MKITCERAYLATALSTVSRAVSTKNTLPILSHILIEAVDDRLNITATDLDTAIRCSVPASIADGGSLAIPASTFSDYISKLSDGPVTLETKEGKVLIRSGHSRFTVVSAPAEDFPTIPAVVEGTEITLTSTLLKEMLHKTTFAASKEESRSLLMGVLFEANGNLLSLVATDTHRLALKQTDLEETVSASVSAIVPAKPLQELERMLKNTVDEKVTVRFGASQVQFESPDVTLVSRVLDGKFPNYEKVIPKSTSRKVVFNRAELLSAVRRVDIVSRFASQKMAVKFTESTMIMNAESSETGQAYEEIPIALDGADLQIAFNAKYLSEVLNIIGEDDLSLDLNESLNPGILKVNGKDDFVYIVMPMQL